MELVVIKYMQLVCLTIFMQNNADCAQLTTQAEAQNNLKLAACSANCLKDDPSLVSGDSLDFQIRVWTLRSAEICLSNRRKLNSLARCFPPAQSLTQCYQECANRTEPLADVTTTQQSLNASFQLYCRDSRRLLIRVESDDFGHVENEKFIYLLVIRETQNTFADHSALIVSSNPFLIQ